MSMDVCKGCGGFVDTDSFPESYLTTKATMHLPKPQQNHECVCENCQGEIDEEELEARIP